MGQLCNALGFFGLITAMGLAGCEPVKRPGATIEEALLPPDAGEMAPLVVGHEAAEGEAPPGDVGVEGPGRVSEQAELVGAIGTVCTEDAQCETYACVDGFCCDSECDGVCVSCGQAGSEGSCQPTEIDEVCPTRNCPQSTECLEYVSTEAGNCAGAWQCRDEAVCAVTPRPVNTPCGEGGQGTCDGLGACLVPDKANLGEGCSVNADCAEGNCVQGADGANICCDSACDGVCEACGANGRCDATPTVDARCEAVECPPNNVCRVYPQLGAGQCAALGDCQGQEACFALAQELRPDAQCDCGQDGDCFLTVGTSCQVDGDCDTGACEATSSGRTICCAQGCGNGLFCAGDGRSCVECEGNTVSCDGNESVQCVSGRLVSSPCVNGCLEGQGCNARAPLGFSCTASQCQQDTVCQNDTDGGRTCCSRDCSAEGKVCAPDGSCDCPPGQQAQGDSCLRQLGERCEVGSQCQRGNCVDGVCCSEPCDGFCASCAVPGQQGQCVGLRAGERDNDPQNQCNNTRECTGVRGECKAGLGEQCNEDDDCASRSCVDTGNGAAVCCATECFGATPLCLARGEGCAAPVCGNNIREGAEECDNGVANGRDSTCDTECRVQVCRSISLASVNRLGDTSCPGVTEYCHSPLDSPSDVARSACEACSGRGDCTETPLDEFGDAEAIIQCSGTPASWAFQHIGEGAQGPAGARRRTTQYFIYGDDPCLLFRSQFLALPEGQVGQVVYSRFSNISASGSGVQGTYLD